MFWSFPRGTAKARRADRCRGGAPRSAACDRCQPWAPMGRGAWVRRRHASRDWVPGCAPPPRGSWAIELLLAVCEVKVTVGSSSWLLLRIEMVRVKHLE